MNKDSFPSPASDGKKWRRYIPPVLLIVLLLAAAWFVRGKITGLFSNADEVLLASSQTLADSNGVHLLREGEFAIKLYQDKSGGKKVSRSVLLSNGQQYDFVASERDYFTVIEYKPGQQTLLSLDDGVTTIHRYDDFDGYDQSGKVDLAISRKLAKQDKAQVIIRMNLPFGHFYEQTDTPDSRNSKWQKFVAGKNQLANIIGGNGRLKQDLPLINGVVAEVNQQALAGLSHNPLVGKVELDRDMEAFLDTSLDQINAKYPWSLIDTQNQPITGVGMRIAIIDTGVDYTHPDLGGCLGTNCKVVGGYDFVNNDGDPMDDHGHGTHVAATAAGKGLLNGVAPDAKIYAYKVLNNVGSGLSSQIIQGIQRAVDPNADGNPSDHVDVISMSLGGSGNPDDSTSQAVDNATAAGVVSVIAAGNSGPNLSTIGSPGTARTAITVAASCKTAQIGTDSACLNGAIASFSSRGPLIWNGVDLKKPDIAAPGRLICAARWASSFPTSPTCFDNQHVRISGTSMATPHMAGVAALVKQANPTYTPAQIKDRLKTTAKNLGLSYNDQGAGEVDVKAAIPVASQITTTPDIWRVTTSPAQKLSTSSQNFSVTPTVSTINTLSVSFTSPVTGVTFTPSKTTLNVANKATDTFSGTLTVDNDVVKGGTYTGIIFFSENGVNKGAIPVSITVSPTIAVTPADTIDYGIDDPSLASWTSASQTLTLTNRRMDSAQTVNVSGGNFVAGITYLAAPSTLNLPAGGSTTVSTNLAVDNTKVANGQYFGSLSITNGANNIAINAKFNKFYTIILTDSNTSDLLNASIWVNDHGSTQMSLTADTSPKRIYLNTAGTYDLKVRYTDQSSNSYVVFKENVAVSGVNTVNISRNEAKNLVKLVTTDENNSPITTTSQKDMGLTYLATFAHNSEAFTSNANIYLSNVSSSYQIDLSARTEGFAAPKTYLFAGSTTGLSAGVNFTNSASDLILTEMHPEVNVAVGAKFQPVIWDCYYARKGICAATTPPSDPAAWPSFPLIQKVYSSRPANWFLRQTINTLPGGCASGAYCSTVFTGPRIDPRTKARYTWADSLPTALPLQTGNFSYTGLGPSIWFAKFNNSATRLQLVQNFSGPTSPLLRQDYSIGEHDVIAYSIYKDGTQVATGSLSSLCAHCDFMSGTDQLGSVNLSAAGKYEFRSSFPYQIRAQNLTGSVIAAFDTTLSDSNPPTIKRLYAFSNGQRSEVYDTAATSTLELELDPVGGTLGNVTVAYALDGATFTPVATALNNGVYNVTLPQVNPSSKLTLRLIASDNSANSLQYTFDLPVGTTSAPPPPPPPPPPGDTTPPIVNITVPTNGSTVTGRVQVRFTAFDNGGFKKYDLYVDNKLDSTILPTAKNLYFVWNASKLTGQHVLVVKAQDLAGNVGSSAPVTVTVTK